MDFKQPNKYEYTELKAAAVRAEIDFRVARRNSEIELAAYYDEIFDKTCEEFEQIMELTNSLADAKAMAPVLFAEKRLDTLRYMERPSVSEDDFKNLSDTGTAAPGRLKEPRTADLAIDYLMRNLNMKLFPWRETGEAPAAEDVKAAKLAVAALVADQRTKTMMRNKASHNQEKAIRDALVNEAEFKVVKGHQFKSLADAPKPGEVFDRETSIDGVKADIVLGLPDGRIMALECKVSNTKVNSYKRLIHETVDKVTKWVDMFGRNGVVGGCVLQGVFSVDNLAAAQDAGVSIFWSSELTRLIDFVKNTAR